AEEREDQGAARPTGRRECPREPEDHGGAGRVVVGARVDDAVGASEVIVVRADDDGFGSERRVVAGQDSDHVRRPDLVDHLLDAKVRARPRRERCRAARRRHRPRRLRDRPTGRRQHEVGSLPCEGARHQRHLDRRPFWRRKLASRDQQRDGPAPLRGDQLVEAGHACVGQMSWGAVERKRNPSASGAASGGTTADRAYAPAATTIRDAERRNVTKRLITRAFYPTSRGRRRYGTAVESPDLIAATRPPVRRTRSSGVSLKTVFG